MESRTAAWLWIVVLFLLVTYCAILYHIGDTTLPVGALLADPISTIFDACVWILQVIGDFTGMGYKLTNIVVFVVLHPALTIWLFVQWRRARRQGEEV
ncbi:MAG: hypothetical protein EXR91_04815 [Gemmatimonadetes bacterium]|nr:hypothetical protein [Gemmatimonadota bacterium]